MTLAVNEKIRFTIIENGYWKADVVGRIIDETPKFWVIMCKTPHFWNSTKGEYVPRRVLKTNGNLRLWS